MQRKETVNAFDFMKEKYGAKLKNLIKFVKN
jgi:hypothetical protein